MAYALGSLNPAICARLEECKAHLIDKADPEILSQILLEMGMLGPKALKNMVFDFYLKYLCDFYFKYFRFNHVVVTNVIC